jgi:3-oxosteroid 1-dehydrogenase
VTGAEADVVVIGSGGAGLVAALAAAVAGAEVMVVEKTSELGGTTAVSGGTIWVGANHLAAAAGCTDTPDETLAYLSAGGGDHVRRDLLEAFVDAGPRMLRFVEQHSPVRFSLGNDTDYHPELPGGKERARSVIPVPFDPGRLGSLAALVRYVDLPVDIAEAFGSLNPPREPSGDGPPPWTRGRALVGGLVAGCLDYNVRFTIGARARQLLTGGGRVGGVRVEQEGGAYEVTARCAVVLASGGFEWNKDLVASFLPASIPAPGSPPSMEGDGLRMAMALGAALGSMNEAWWSPMIQVPGEHYEGHVHSRMVVSQRLYPRSIVVNRSGRRFTNEAKSYHDVGRDLMSIDSEEGTYANRPAWLVYDAVYRQRYGTACIGPLDEDPAWLKPFSTLDGLALHHGIHPAGLAATVDRFNADVACGRDPLFHRGSSRYALSKGDRGQDGIHRTLGPIVEPPFYAVELHAGTIGTRGGPMTDVDGRVIDVWGAVIPGLFAAGNVAASPTGLMYPGAGGTLGLALTFGYLAGQAASEHA